MFLQLRFLASQKALFLLVHKINRDKQLKKEVTKTLDVFQSIFVHPADVCNTANA